MLEALSLKTNILSVSDCLKLKDLLTEYQHVFALDNPELSSTDLVEHRIDTGDSKPIHQYSRRVPLALREKVSKMIQEMLKQDIFQNSQSSWASLVVLEQSVMAQ